MRRFGLAAVLVLALGAAACSDDGDGDDAASGEGKEYVDAFAASMLVDTEDVISEDQAQCAGEAYVDTVGVDRLEGAVTPEEVRQGDPFTSLDLDDDTAGTVYDSMNKCVDFKKVLVAQLVADQEVSNESAQCIDEKLDDALIKRMAVSMMQGDNLEDDPELEAELEAALTECFTE